MNSSDLIKISLSLALVVLLIFLLALLARRFGLTTDSSQSPLRIIQKLRLGPRLQLMIVETENKRLLIGVTPHHISLLDQEAQPNTPQPHNSHKSPAQGLPPTPAPVGPPNPFAEQTDFAEQLKGQIKQQRQAHSLPEQSTKQTTTFSLDDHGQHEKHSEAVPHRQQGQQGQQGQQEQQGQYGQQAQLKEQAQLPQQEQRTQQRLQQKPRRFWSTPRPDAPTNWRQIIILSVLMGLLLLFLIFFSSSSHAQSIPIPAITGNIDDQGQQVWSLSVETLVFLTLLTFIPAALVMMTGFTRIIIVLGLLRNAMGTGAAPPNSILVGIALFLTFFAMAPVFDQIYTDAYEPLTRDEISFPDALERGVGPLKEFMLHQTRENDLIFYADLAQAGPFEGPEQVPLRILVPAFITSELKTAFQIGFTIFIPFLIIDLLVASVLMSLGMMMVPPVTISLPFKLMLFVLADGWHLLLGSLARSFYL